MNVICKIVKEGQKVELAIEYNDGHKSCTLNFSIRYAAMKLSNGLGLGMRTSSTAIHHMQFNDIVSVVGAPSTTQNYPIDATDSKQSGYVSVNLEYNHIIMYSRILLWCFV